MVFAKCTSRRFEILLFKGGSHVRGNQFILCHDVWLEPDAHRVVRCQHIKLTDPRYTFHARLDVDLHVVVDELHIVAVVGAVQSYHFQQRLLLFEGLYADLRHLGRKQSLRFRHAVLHVYGGHIGIDPLTEIYVHRHIARIGGFGVDV